ncbi:unnamed protein product [marine sediment metagenome]|uniref:CARDB domain-containing protein n=1 Tax=marine sediment metagenome TaxID=412755 RepID=X1H7S8_9ZZZZ
MAEMESVEKDMMKTMVVIMGLAILASVIQGMIPQPAPDPIPPGEVLLSNLVIEPLEVNVGETVTIGVTATNIGEAGGSYEVTCEVI